MDKHRLVMAGVGLAILIVLALGYLLGVQPQLAAAADAKAQAATIDQANQATQVQLTRLQKDYAKLGEFTSQLATAQTSIPSTPSLDKLLSDLRALAASTGTTVTTFTPAQPVAYTPPVAPPAPAPAPAGGSSTPAPTATPVAPAAPAAPVAPRPATNALITAQNFVAIPITLTISGSTDAALAFMDGLQHGPRLFLVNGFSGKSQASAAQSGASKPAAPTAATPYTINGFVYVLQQSKDATPTPSK